MAGYRRPSGFHSSLVVGQRHQMDGGLGLARKASAQTGCRRNPRRRRRLAARPAGVGRIRRRMGVLRGRRADRVGSGQALSLPLVHQDPQMAGGGLLGSGLSHCGTHQDELLDAASRLGAGGLAAGRQRSGASNPVRPNRRRPQGARHHCGPDRISRAARARNRRGTGRGLAGSCGRAVRLHHLGQD